MLPSLCSLLNLWDIVTVFPLLFRFRVRIIRFVEQSPKQGVLILLYSITIRAGAIRYVMQRKRSSKCKFTPELQQLQGFRTLSSSFQHPPSVSSP